MRSSFITSRTAASLAAFAACALAGCQDGSQPFVCPTIDAQGRGDALPESAQAMAELGAQLSSDTEGNVLGEVIFDLRRRYPKAQDAAIVDYIVTARCPAIAADASQSDADKRDAFDAFAQMVFDRVQS